MPRLRSVSIANVRGIARGELDGFAALTLLTGPNGCGKSSVLEALAIAASPTPEDALGEAIGRRRNIRNGARWFVHGEAGSVAEVRAVLDQGSAAGFAAKYGPLLTWSQGQDAPRPQARIVVSDPGDIDPPRDAPQKPVGLVHFAGDNRFVVVQRKPPLAAPIQSVRLIDPAVQTSFEAVYSEAFRRGRKREFLALLADVDPRITGCDLLSEDDGTPVLYLTLGEAVIPIGAAGDGLQTLARLALELAATPRGLVLVEEPEVCLHPRAIALAARTLLAAARRDVQLIVSTHSLELIDAVIAAADEPDLGRLVLFNLALERGELRSSRFAGPDLAYSREVIANDLR